MEINSEEIPFDVRYKLLTGTIVPRPIALVSTISPNGDCNLAPFSYFNIVGHNPMALSFSVAGIKPNRSNKDTFTNIAAEEKSEFVINIVNEAIAVKMAKTATVLDYGVCEFEYSGLTKEKSLTVKPYRVKESPVSFECETFKIIEVGISKLIIGLVKHLYVSDELLEDNFRVNQSKLKAVGRMAGSSYCVSTNLFTVDDEKFFPL
ncbi:flavin reductase family protein [Parasediminibacterium sp. JCM 36343]|uniref:flavin reductase family protein n=1 Tax=Parasediminibacterium sp. JCM 36343 TaxID=3374279 RepID=UPI00397BAB83